MSILAFISVNPPTKEQLKAAGDKGATLVHIPPEIAGKIFGETDFFDGIVVTNDNLECVAFFSSEREYETGITSNDFHMFDLVPESED